VSEVAHRIETARLLMRNWQIEDAPAYRALLDASDQQLRPWIPWMKDEPMSLEGTRSRLEKCLKDFDEGINFRYPVFLKDGTLIGETGLYTRAGEGARETGYLIGGGYPGAGYATEATMAMIRVGFEIDEIDRIELHCAPENSASNRVALKLGCTLEATLRRRYLDSEGHRHDSNIWSLFASSYPASPAAKLPIEAYAADRQRLL
jgi:RimJ/RimL family protein N-acetyltransferase